MDLDRVRWRKSSWSGGQGDPEKSDCVEVAMVDTAVPASAAAIRDSKNPGLTLLLPESAWSGLLERLLC